MTDIARITITGNVASVRDIQTSKSGKTVLNFGIGVADGVPGDVTRNHTTFYNVAQWGPKDALETLKAKLTKGLRVTVNGPLSTREFTGQDGSVRLNLNVFANRLDLPRTEEDVDDEMLDAVPA